MVPLIQEPLLILLTLLAVVIVAQKATTRFHRTALMRYLPTPVWCYVPPTLLTTLGFLPPTSGVYDWIGRYVLPACLILLLMSTDLKGLQKVGRLALIAMMSATISVLIGAVVVFFVFRNQLGPESWKAIGTFAASWIGGTANMVAVKEATELADELFAPLFISDITVVYLWMTFLMVASSWQRKIDQLLSAKRSQLSEALAASEPPKPRSETIPSRSLVLLLVIGFGIGSAMIWLGGKMAHVAPALNDSTWIIILVTTAGLGLAATRFSRSEGANANQVGYFLLYLVLASTGAKANLLAMFQAPIFLAIGFVWLVIHASIILAAGWLFRIPSAMLAAASQANLGGVASAPVVASTYEPKLVPVALILALLGNAIANYLGILTGQLLFVIGV